MSSYKRIYVWVTYDELTGTDKLFYPLTSYYNTQLKQTFYNVERYEKIE